jgi:NAD/NADP transhydrogenase beta subunit
MREILIELCYIVAAVLFIFGLKMLSSPDTARRGNIISAVGMFLAIAATLAIPTSTPICSFSSGRPSASSSAPSRPTASR